MVLTTPDEMTAEWSNSVLTRAGALRGAQVSAVETEPVTDGVIARMIKAKLTYSEPTDAPASVIVKYTTDDPAV